MVARLGKSRGHILKCGVLRFAVRCHFIACESKIVHFVINIASSTFSSKRCGCPCYRLQFAGEPGRCGHGESTFSIVGNKFGRLYDQFVTAVCSSHAIILHSPILIVNARHCQSFRHTRTQNQTQALSEREIFSGIIIWTHSLLWAICLPMDASTMMLKFLHFSISPFFGKMDKNASVQSHRFTSTHTFIHFSLTCYVWQQPRWRRSRNKKKVGASIVYLPHDENGTAFLVALFRRL